MEMGKWANRLKIYDSEKNRTPGAGLPPPQGSIHVYIAIISKDLLL